MQKWDYMSVSQTDCRSYKEIQDWITKKTIEAGDQGYELSVFDISKVGLMKTRWHGMVLFKRPRI